MRIQAGEDSLLVKSRIHEWEGRSHRGAKEGLRSEPRLTRWPTFEQACFDPSG